MGHDPFSPITSARVHVLVLPAKARPHRFATFVSLLTQENAIRLSDLVGSEPSVTSLFSPETFPKGQILFNVSASGSPWSFESFPFELNRQAQIILAVVDGAEIWPAGNRVTESSQLNETALEDALTQFATTNTSSKSLMLRKVLVFDKPSHIQDREDVLYASSTAEDVKHTSQHVLNQIAGPFLVALERRAEALKNAEIESPRAFVKTRQHSSWPSNRMPTNLRNQAAGRDTPTTSSRPTTPASEGGSTMQQDLRLVNGHAIQDSNHSSATSLENKSAYSKARYQVTLGNMYLQAGQWADAIRELCEGAVSTRSSTLDYLWQAKALESLVICMILLSWTQIEFSIPRVCYAPYAIDQAQAASSMNLQQSGQATASLKDVFVLIPGLARTILSLYGQAFSMPRDQLPRTLLLETRVRLSNLLSFANLMHGNHIDRGLINDSLIGSAPVPMAPVPATATSEIANILVDTAAALENDVLPYEAIMILCGIAHSLSNLGAGRKYAFHLKFLLERIVPSLVEARKLGAAEMGIHPAAGLSIQSGLLSDLTAKSQQGLRVLLGLAVEAYNLLPMRDTRPCQSAIRRDAAETEHQLRESARHGLVGDVLLKLEILRLCINVCEALPDLEAGLHFTVQMLTTAKGCATVSQIRGGKLPLIGQDEQIRLLNNIGRTVAAANKLGLKDLRARYWDDLMVRKIELIDSNSSNKLILHKPQDLFLAVSRSEDAKKDPFIYNPFSKSSAGSASHAVLVCDEMTSFGVVLQNPFQFDVEIDEVTLMAEGCDFEACTHSVVLGHLCSQSFVLTGIPRSSGTLRITGCRARVRDCYEQEFLMYPTDWYEPALTKHKISGFKRAGRRLPAVVEDEVKPSRSTSTMLQAETLSITVIKSQPVISVASSSLPQSSLMLLDGEDTELRLTLHNESRSAMADLLLVTFEDSVTSQIQSALAGKESSPAELYELQHRLASRPAIDWLPSTKDDVESHILPGESRTFTFKVYGKPGLSHALINVDYAHLGLPRSEVTQSFYTRQIQYPISMTVNSGVEVPRVNALPLDGGSSGATEAERAARTRENLVEDESKFLLLLDLRNVWPNPLSVVVQATVSQLPTTSASENQDVRNSVREELQPGYVTRIVIPVPRLFIADPHAPIPFIGAKRQFVVSASKLSPEAELASRESFWFREELLRNITGHWKETGTSREGEIDFRRAIRLNARMIATMKIDHVELDFTVRPCPTPGVSEKMGDVPQPSRSTFILRADHFYTLTVSVCNRSQEALLLLLRLQPSLRNQPYHTALDLSKRLVWSGMLQRVLHPALQPGETRTAELGITPLVAGCFEIGASVEEVLSRRLPQGTKRAPAIQSTDRRIWHARQPCHLDVSYDSIAHRRVT